MLSLEGCAQDRDSPVRAARSTLMRAAASHNKPGKLTPNPLGTRAHVQCLVPVPGFHSSPSARPPFPFSQLHRAISRRQQSVCRE